MDLTIVTCNYNTPELIVNLVKSIKKFCKSVPEILVVETGSVVDTTLQLDDVRYLYSPNSPHGIGVNKALEHIKTEYVLLVDSDVLFLRDFEHPFNVFKNKNLTLMGKVVGDCGGKSLYERIEPWYCFINAKKLKENKIKFFDSERTKQSKDEGSKIYDVGSTMFEDVINSGLDIGNSDMEGKYFRHYGGMSWREQKYNPNDVDTDIDFGGTHPHKVLWDIAQQVKRQYYNDVNTIFNCIPKFKDLMKEISDHPKWDLCSKHYDRYLERQNEPVLIPKKIHQIWLGGEVPSRVLELTEKIKKFHPDWEYKLWTDKDVDSLSFFNKKLYDLHDNYGTKSDILRLEILFKEGGIYLDTDFDIVRPFDEILGGVEFFIGVGQVEHPEVLNSILGSTARNELVHQLIINMGKESIIDKVVEDYPHTGRGETFTITGPYYLSHMIFNYMSEHPNHRNVVFPTEYFYPFPADHRFTLWNKGRQGMWDFIHKHNTPNTVAIHLWDCSWQHQSWVR